MTTAFTIPAAAKAAGTTVATVEAFIRAGAIRTARQNGQTTVTAEGLGQLRGYTAKIRQEVAAEAQTSAAQRSAQADSENPADWTDEQISARAKKISDELRGAGPDPSFGGGVEIIRIPEGR